MTDWQRVHTFWFQTIPEERSSASYHEYLKERNHVWFAGSESLDAEIAEKFESTIHQAASGAFTSWEAEPRSCLALLLLFDQFTRSIYRGTPQAFSFDPAALRIAHHARTMEFDQQVTLPERVFFYLPFEHAEELPDQMLSLQKFQMLYEASPDSAKSECKGFLDYARAHKRTIEKFGRFPARNAILGRVSTDEEDAFLAAGNKFIFDFDQ
jgi:uncharacterized protein (DUF924 family)